MGKERSNLILIGFPSSGKSTLGRTIAKKTGRSFIDLDQVIMQQEGRTLQQILDVEGDEGFLEIEHNTVLQFHAENSVIATGGSVPYFDDSMDHLRRQGIVVCLWISPETAENRLWNLSDRGVVLPEGWTLRDLYEYRQKLYERACDVVVDVDDVSVRGAADRILRVLNGDWPVRMKPSR
ncbi:MAG: shikimate kinase [Eubacteriales bacterium]|nr:shikimate kinase [Eubacteriales bacterium]